MTGNVLRPAQVEDLTYLMSNDRAALLHDPGVGKTYPVAVYLYWRWSAKAEKSAWVMPKSLFEKNRDDLLAWSHFAPEDVLILEDLPIEVRKLKLVVACRAGLVRLVTTPDIPMINVLDSAKRSVLFKDKGRWEAPGAVINQLAIKKALKEGWITLGEKPGITIQGAEKLTGGLMFRQYQNGKEKPSTSLVDGLIKDGCLKVDPETGAVTVGGIMNDILWITRLKFQAKVLIMGFDFFSQNAEWLLELNPEIKVAAVDEIHLGYSDINSARTLKFMDAMRKIPAFVPMTGTLVNGKLSTAYPTIKLCEPRFYASHDDFMTQHGVFDDYGKRVGWKNHEKVQTILGRIGRRRSFEQEYGVENKVIINEWVTMTPKLRESYDQFHDEAMLELEDRFLDGSLPGVATIRARQIMQCPEIFGLHKDETTAKDERLKLYLGDCAEDGEAFAIFSCFQPEHERLATMTEALGLRVDYINGNVSPTNRARIDKAFQAHELDVVIASEATAGIGYNWGHLNRMAFASIDYQDGNLGQAYRRAIRGKRSQALLVYVLGYKNSVDHRVFQIVDQKSRDAHLVDPTREIFTLSQRAA
jgi:hypothetical protein